MPRQQNYKLIIQNQIKSQRQFESFRMKVEIFQTQWQKKSSFCEQRILASSFIEMISLLSCHIDNSKKPDLVFEKEKSRETDFQCLSSILADIDECSQEPCLGVENSICKNSNGSYNCECIEGFRKSADGSTCEGKKKKPKRAFHYGLKTNIKPRHDVIYVHKLTHRIQGTCLLMLWWSVM